MEALRWISERRLSDGVLRTPRQLRSAASLGTEN